MLGKWEYVSEKCFSVRHKTAGKNISIVWLCISLAIRVCVSWGQDEDNFSDACYYR